MKNLFRVASILWLALLFGPATSGHALTATASPSPSAQCTGDCREPLGVVTIDEIITCVNIGLERLPGPSCSTCDRNGDSKVTIDELITAVNTGLELLPCNAEAGPTRTPTPEVVCTPPPCAGDEVLHCEDECPGGCGFECATPTPGCQGCSLLGSLSVSEPTVEPALPIVGDQITLRFPVSYALPGGFDCTYGCILDGAEPYLSGSEPPEFVGSEVVIRRQVAQPGTARIQLRVTAETEEECLFGDPPDCDSYYQYTFIHGSSSPFDLVLRAPRD
jgi:hypothetical protein